MFHIKLNASSILLRSLKTEYKSITTPIPAMSPPFVFSSIEDENEIKYSAISGCASKLLFITPSTKDSRPKPFAIANAKAIIGTIDKSVKKVNAEARTEQPFSTKPLTAIITILRMLKE